ncbi:MAG TPA: MraY family glycosyltransferase, partial [Tepidisphaeraceae bacterium]|nr:MraY family glycosyltransferase [Tepidisphaeraceae bacterium]
SYYHVIDEPDRLRKMHSEPVAYLGGVAVFLGWLAGLAISQFLRLHQVPPGWEIGHLVVKFSIVLGALVIVVLGLWDDIRGVRPSVKILGQVVAALLLLADGVGIRATQPILSVMARFLQAKTGFEASPEVFDALVQVSSSLFVVVVIVGCCNASNLMDGLDGLCGGVTAVIAAGFLFVAVHLAMTGSALNTNWDGLRVVLGLALLGAVLGFIPYNFNPASIFMGDTGSMFLGYSCGVTMILMAQERPRWFLASVIMFALPILDTTLAFTRRYVNGRPLFSADKQHFHHQMISRGLSVKQTVLVAYGLAVGFALLGVIMVYLRTRYAVALYLVIFGSIIVAAYKMGMVHEKPRIVTRRPLASLEGDERLTASTPPVALEPGGVLEVREDDRRGSPPNSAAPASTAAAVEGAWGN